jgi:hypothetical protein
VKKYSLPVSLPAEAQLLENAKTKKGTLTAPAESDPKTSKIVGMKPK